jgi:hypothetical protein
LAFTFPIPRPNHPKISSFSAFCSKTASYPTHPSALIYPANGFLISTLFLLSFLAKIIWLSLQMILWQELLDCFVGFKSLCFSVNYFEFISVHYYVSFTNESELALIIFMTTRANCTPFNIHFQQIFILIFSFYFR